MKTFRFAKTLSLSLLAGLTIGIAASAAPFTVQNYNDALPVWGTSWGPGNDASSGYYPSFYTGFAPRSSYPNRIHVRLARGNQTRVTVTLDEETVSDYLFDLVKRYEFYKSITSGTRPVLDVTPNGAVLQQLNLFNQTIESEQYGILPFVARAKAGQESPESIYRKGLETIQALNPGRVFPLRFNLTNEFMKWKGQVKEMLGAERDTDAFFAKNPEKAAIAINSMLFGRINYTQPLVASNVVNLASVAELVNLEWKDDDFIWSANDIFKIFTGSKFNFKVLNDQGQFVSALDCQSAAHCTLSYPEFTAIYPTGSVRSYIRDQFGNSIPNFATPGLWSFIDRTGGRGVDNIRDDPFYGWAPKMDYEEIGNGFHNPAVRFQNVDRSVKDILGIPAEHTSLWSVMRGGVSHGCSRLPLGHVWEMRHIFPVESVNMAKINYFGSNPRDFDVYDIDGDGQLEVIGVEYLISYGLQGTEGLGSREGSNLEIGSLNKLAFYENLYGSKNVFTPSVNGKFYFTNPSVSLPSALDYLKKSVQARLTVNGQIPLYEAAYERDKVQLYAAKGMNKNIVRLMGRVRGCAPSTNKEACGEAAFDREAASLLRETR